jgi:hypothetical protein
MKVGLVLISVVFATCPTTVTVIPKDKWFVAEKALMDMIGNGTITSTCIKNEVKLLNDSHANLAVLNQIVKKTTTDELRVQFFAPIEGGKFSADEQLEKFMIALMYAADNRLIFPITLTFDLVYPNPAFLVNFISKLDRLTAHLKFKFGRDAVRVNYRLTTRINNLAVHLIAETADQITLVHPRGPVGLTTALTNFLSEDCVLCRMFVYPRVAYDFQLMTEVSTTTRS